MFNACNVIGNFQNMGNMKEKVINIWETVSEPLEVGWREEEEGWGDGAGPQSCDSCWTDEAFQVWYLSEMRG